MSESALYNAIIGEYSNGDCRLLRINAGMAYQGRVIERSPHRLILSPWYPVRLAVEGVSDLLGWCDGGRFLAIEAKLGRRQMTEEQRNFIELVRRSGGRAGIARSVEDAGAIIRGDAL